MAVCGGKSVVKKRKRAGRDLQMTLQGEMHHAALYAAIRGGSANTMSTQRRARIEKVTFYRRGGQEVIRPSQQGECDFGGQ
jgi:hypothetical protein